MTNKEMKYIGILAVTILCATGCATSRDLAVRDQRIAGLEARLAELTERLQVNEKIVRSGDIPMILKLIDERENEPIIQVELIGEP